MKLLKHSLIGAALLAASPVLFANTAISANSSTQVAVQAQTPGVLNNLGQDIKTIAHKTGDTVVQGAEHTKEASQAKWDTTKDKVAEIKATQEAKAEEHEQSLHDDAEKSHDLLKSKTEQSKKFASDKSEKTKSYLKSKNQKLKDHINQPRSAGFDGEGSAQVKTPVGSAEIKTSAKTEVSKK